jgi:hypothetical protein
MSDDKPTRFEPIAVSSESTVVAEYVPESASAVSPVSQMLRVLRRCRRAPAT